MPKLRIPFRNWFASRKSVEPALPRSRPTSILRGFGSGRLRSNLSILLPGTRYDYETEAGDLALNSIVAACLEFYFFNWPQARPRVSRLIEGTESLIADHPVVQLLQRPDPTMPAVQFWEQVLVDFWIHGAACIYKRRDKGGLGKPIALQWLPADMVDAVMDERDPNGVVYPYRVWGKLVKTIPSEDMIYIKWGRDVQNHLRGRSYLISALREIAADNSHSTLAGAMSRNNGVGGFVISPKDSTVTSESPYAAASEDDADTIKRRIQEQITGDEAGSSVVLTSDFHMEKLSFSPQELALDDARATPEERICAIFRIPPIVVGMGAGLRRATMANYAEARKQAWEEGVLPLLDYFSDVFTHALLDDFPETQEGDLIAYDTTRVRALRDDESAKVKDAAIAYRAGIWDRETAKVHSGKAAMPEDAGVYVTSGAKPTNPIPEPIKRNRKATKDVGDDLLSEARRQRAALVGVQQDAADAVAEVLAQARTGLEKLIGEILSDIEAIEAAGGTVSEGEIQRLDRYQQLLRQAEAAFNDKAEESARLVTGKQTEAAGMGAEGAQSLVAAIGIDSPWVSLPAATLRALAGNLGNGTPLFDHFQTLGPDAANTIRKALAESIAAGKNPRAIASALAGAVGVSMARAETIARTETIRAYREATRQTYAANSSVVEGYIRLSAADARTCAACWALHGTEHDTSEIMPSHPNCRCVMIPKVEDGPSVPDRDESFGAMSEAEQKRVLGEQGYDLWKDGLSLSSFAVVEDGGKFGPTARVANLAELGALL